MVVETSLDFSARAAGEAEGSSQPHALCSPIPMGWVGTAALGCLAPRSAKPFIPAVLCKFLLSPQEEAESIQAPGVGKASPAQRAELILSRNLGRDKGKEENSTVLSWLRSLALQRRLGSSYLPRTAHICLEAQLL